MGIDHLPPWHEDRFKAKPHPAAAPNHDIIHGAREYNKSIGLDDPHKTDYHKIHLNPEHMKQTAKLYDGLPHNDPEAHKAFHSFKNQVNDQYNHITNNMGIKMHVTHDDPYESHADMMHDLKHNKRLKVLSTESTGGHPFLSNEENDKFRFVHDIFGHAATGRPFDSHGETAAYHAHKQMFHGPARHALATETYGQNSSLIANGKFPPQKVALLPADHLDSKDSHTKESSLRLESGRAQDFWDKMKGKIRERRQHNNDSSWDGKSNPGDYFAPATEKSRGGQHRQDPKGNVLSEPKGRHTKDQQSGPGQHRKQDPGLFSSPSGKHVQEKTPQKSGPGKHRQTDKPGLFSEPKGKHVQEKSAPKIHQLEFTNADTGMKHNLHVHVNADGSISHVREHNDPGQDTRGKEPHSPENTHPASPQKGSSDVGKSPVRNRPARPPMDINVDPLTSPHHVVDRSLNTPIHEQLHRDSQNPLTAPGRHSNPNDPTPTADDANVHNEMNRRLKGKPNLVQEIKNPGDRKNMKYDELKSRIKQGASGLDQIQQTVNVHDEYDPRSMPQDVAFPIVNNWGEETTEDGDYSADRNGEYRSRTAQLEDLKRYAMQLMEGANTLYKMADMFGASDSPHAVPGGSVANSPFTTPPEVAGKGYEQGLVDGQRDRTNGERPSFANASSGASEYVQGYSKGYSTVQAPPEPQNVPRSMGGDSGQAMNAERVQQREQDGRPLNVGASLTVSASFTESEALSSRDFVKGYNYGRKWTPQRRMVSLGSAEFEAGLYAGITDNPENQRAFVETNKRHASLKSRLGLHTEATRRFSEGEYDTLVRGLYIQGSTSTDLNIMGPGVAPDPMGNTPLMGPGTPPPNAGGMNPAAPGGPAPYNGAQPTGTSVVENPVMGPVQPSPPAESVPGRGSAHTQNNDGNRAPNNNIPGEQPLQSSSMAKKQAFRNMIQRRLQEIRG